jgi:hypothetical protein
MAQKGKQVRVGAREGLPYNPVKVVLLANDNRSEVDSKTFFISGKALYHDCPVPNLTFFWHTFKSVVCG